jgi:hypothetical protein
MGNALHIQSLKKFYNIELTKCDAENKTIRNKKSTIPTLVIKQCNNVAN